MMSSSSLALMQQQRLCEPIVRRRQRQRPIESASNECPTNSDDLLPTAQLVELAASRNSEACSAQRGPSCEPESSSLGLNAKRLCDKRRDAVDMRDALMVAASESDELGRVVLPITGRRFAAEAAAVGGGWRQSATQLALFLLICAHSSLQSSFATPRNRLNSQAELGRRSSSGWPQSMGNMTQLQSVASANNANNHQDDEARAAHWSLPNRPSLFNIIRFPNEECFDSSNQSGTCYTAFECKLLGGQPSSPCAAGFGSCCIVSRTCHVTTREKVVYFKNPSYPSADSDEKFCDLTVEMSDLNVCQLRLDFLDFQLDPPTNGACKDDYLEISASGMPPQTVPRLCGMNRNQHLYINLPQELSERSASIVFYTDPVGDHRWQVKVTQIDCNHYRPIDWKRHYAKFATSPLWNAHPNLNGNGVRLGAGKYSTTFASGFQTMSQTASALAYEFLRPQFTPRAPMGCLQYFNQPSGIIESFNFGQYLNNMDYSICIQRQPDTCRIVFASSDYDWSLNGVGISGSSSGVGDQDCARDYLLIPGASRTGDGFTYDRYCGGRLHYYRGQTLSAPVVMKTSGPIVLRFHSDAHFESINNGGFRIQYDQSTQDCVYHTAEEAGSLASQQLIMSTLSDSRPLGPFITDNAASPVLYAAQQLSPVPMVQQQQQQQVIVVDEPIKAIRPLLTNDSAALSNSLQRPNFESDSHSHNQPSFNDDRMRRRQDNSEDSLRPQQVDMSSSNRSPSAKLASDLSKAFQLITMTRSARLLDQARHSFSG